MTFEQLSYFYALSKHLNFTKASEALYISQPTLSRQISLLEEELGSALFYRNNRGVQLTAAGQLLLEDVPELLEKMDDLQKRIRRTKDGQEGILRIYSLYFFYPELNQVYRQFLEANPGIQLTMYKSDGNLLPDESEKLNVDVGIGFDFERSPSNREEYACLPLYEDKFCAIMSEDHPLASEPDLTVAQVSSQKLLSLSRAESPILQSIGKQLNIHHPKTIQSVHSSVIEDVVLHIRADRNAVFLAPYPAIDVMPPGCISKDVVDLQSSFQVVMTWPKANQSAALKTFVKMVKEAFSDGPIKMH